MIPHLDGGRPVWDRSKDEIMRQVEESVRKHGKTGFVDPTLLRERKVLATETR